MILSWIILALQVYKLIENNTNNNYYFLSSRLHICDIFHRIGDNFRILDIFLPKEIFECQRSWEDSTIALNKIEAFNLKIYFKMTKIRYLHWGRFQLRLHVMERQKNNQRIVTKFVPINMSFLEDQFFTKR